MQEKWNRGEGPCCFSRKQLSCRLSRRSPQGEGGTAADLSAEASVKAEARDAKADLSRREARRAKAEAAPRSLRRSLFATRHSPPKACLG
jgi:hypothetical protein